MAFHVRDSETDALVRRLAQGRGVSLTQAIKEAAAETLAADEQRRSQAPPLQERLQPLWDRMARYPRTGLSADKQFFDELWDDEGR